MLDSLLHRLLISVERRFDIFNLLALELGLIPSCLQLHFVLLGLPLELVLLFNAVALLLLSFEVGFLVVLKRGGELAEIFP